MNVKPLLGAAVLMTLSACGSNGSHTETNTASAPSTSATWKLVWADEFDAVSIDTRKWSFEINCWGGGNNESQCYTQRPENAFLENGVLHIVARREDHTGPSENEDSPNYSSAPMRTLPYTSARLRSKFKGDWKFGRFEVRAQLPFGQGSWPAIWMLPTDNVYGTWAASGEIDIMEAVNLKTRTDAANAPTDKQENRVHGTLHYGKVAPGNVYTGASYELPANTNPADDYHVYAIEWRDGEIRWFVDDVLYSTQTSASWYTSYVNNTGTLVKGSGSAPFDQRFHLLLNLAVGGNWAANVNQKGIDESVFPQTLKIDYVRVYQQ